MPKSVRLMSRSKVLIASTMKRSRLLSITVYALGLTVSVATSPEDEIGNLTTCPAAMVAAVGLLRPSQ